jgi:hypothetical protein
MASSCDRQASWGCGEGEQSPLAGYAFESVATAVGQVSSRPVEEFACGLGNADFTAASEPSHACGDVNRKPGNVAAADQAFPGVQSAAHADPEAGCLCHEAPRAMECAARIPEQREYSVAGGLDQPSTVPVYEPRRGAVVCFQQATPGVIADPDEMRCRVLDVREQHGRVSTRVNVLERMCVIANASEMTPRGHPPDLT